MKRSWIVGGWLFALVASAIPSLWMAADLAERLEAHPVRITQLAHGLPVGGELDYLDEGTLAQALRARRPVG
jgi:recombinational DNA repair protein RecR